MKPQGKMEVTSPNHLGGAVVDEEEEGLGLGLGSGLGLSPVSSKYSSCEESEFDRYCSANSMLGTPASVSGSIGHFHDSIDSDFEGFKLGVARVSRPGKGYARSLLGRESGLSEGHCESSECDNGQGFEGLMGGLDDGEGDDFGAIDCLEGFNLSGGRVTRPFKGKGNGNNRLLLGREAGLSDHGEGFEGMVMMGSVDDGEGSPSSSGGVMKGLGRKEEGKLVCGEEVGKKKNLAVILKNVENVLLQGAVAARSAAENLLECSNYADEMDDERCREQDETSSRYEHSEGEDSIFNYGSDDDFASHRHADYVKNVGDHQHHREGGGFRNSMLMNSSVAFGSNDWEEFELDGMENMKQIPEDFWVRQQSGCENEINSPDLILMRSTPVEKFQWREEETSERNVATNNDPLEVDKSLECSLSSITKTTETKATESVGEVLGRQRLITSNEESDEYLENCAVYNVFQKQSPTEHDVGENESMMCEKERKNLDITSDISSGHDDLPVPLQCLKSPPHILADEDQFPSDVPEDLKLVVLQVQGARFETSFKSNSASTLLESEEGRICGDSHRHDSQNSSSQAKDFEMNDLYDEFVHEMEEILLESCGTPGITLKQKNSEFQFEQSSLGNSDSISSSSGFVGGTLLNHHPLRIDKVEVVDAKQKKGAISLSERLVGVKEYTVYIIRVWSGKYQWDVERRYRDFYELYHQLKTYFAAREWILPPVWSSADKESRKFFGSTSPNVVAERSSLIQECLCTILQPKYCSSLPSCLIWFLCPPEALLSSSQSNVVVRQSNMGPRPERVPSLGKTISLIVDIRSHKPVKELLDTQHYTCAGCHSRIDNGRSRMLDIVQTFGWGKPRLCEYTGQLFCSSCHTNETAVLPARVLHNWDFSPYPVSQLAKSYLDSIVDKPMLCVSAANPSLFSRVPALLVVVGVRRKIGTMVPYIRCSFRRIIYRRLGYRKYLLESNDFFALRDLVDLSKGAFAGLPAILEAVFKKIEEHITELCLECCDNGVPCGARQACDDLSSLIFPFQEDEILRCKSCKSVFHKHCFNKLMECPCGEVLRVNSGSMAGSSSLAMKKSDSKSSSRLLSSLFSFSRQEKGQKENDNVILMGSLPGNSL